MHESVTSQSLLYITVRELYDLQAQEHVQNSVNMRDGSITVRSPALMKGAPSPFSVAHHCSRAVSFTITRAYPEE
jgi:hypothetical protein